MKRAQEVASITIQTERSCLTDFSRYDFHSFSRPSYICIKYILYLICLALVNMLYIKHIFAIDSHLPVIVIYLFSLIALYQLIDMSQCI